MYEGVPLIAVHFTLPTLNSRCLTSARHLLGREEAADAALV